MLTTPMFTNLLFFGLAQGDLYQDWYDNSALIWAVGLSVVVAALASVIFYYLVSRIKALTNGHYYLTMIISAIVTGGFGWLSSYMLIAKYAEDNMLEQLQPGISATLSSGTLDMFYYGLICIPFGILAFFLVSIVLKRWSTYYNIPFGRTHRQPKKK